MQPLTADVWGAGADNPYGWLKKPGIYAEIEEHSIALSDIITFHYYGDYTHSRQYVDFLRRFNRPLINTEWLHRPFRSLIQTHLPMWKKKEWEAISSALSMERASLIMCGNLSKSCRISTPPFGCMIFSMRISDLMTEKK